MSYEQSKISTRMYGKMINDICPTIKVSQGSGIYGEFKIKINRLKKWDSSIGGTYFRGQINGECDITITCDQSNSYFNRRHPKQIREWIRHDYRIKRLINDEVIFLGFENIIIKKITFEYFKS